MTRGDGVTDSAPLPQKGVELCGSRPAIAQKRLWPRLPTETYNNCTRPKMSTSSFQRVGGKSRAAGGGRDGGLIREGSSAGSPPGPHTPPS